MTEMANILDRKGGNAALSGFVLLPREPHAAMLFRQQLQGQRCRWPL